MYQSLEEAFVVENFIWQKEFGFGSNSCICQQNTLSKKYHNWLTKNNILVEKLTENLQICVIYVMSPYVG